MQNDWGTVKDKYFTYSTLPRNNNNNNSIFPLKGVIILSLFSPNICLIIFFLSHNKFDDEGIKYIFGGLKINTSLIQLDLEVMG